MEEMITIRELLAAVLWRWKKVLALTVLFAVLLGGVQAFRMGAGRSADPAASEEYRQTVEEYTRTHRALAAARDEAAQALAQAEEYMENSLLLRVDPYDVCTCAAIYTVAGEDGSALRKLTDDTVEHMMTMICRSYALHWMYAELRESTAGTAYQDVEAKYFREMVTMEADGGLLWVSVRGAEEEACRQALAVVEDCLTAQTAAVAGATCPHRLIRVELAISYEMDPLLAAAQVSAADEVLTQQENLKAREKELGELREPAYADYSSAEFCKSVAKFMAVGAVLGFVLGCLLVLWANIAHKRLESANQAERVLSIPCLGNVAKLEKGLRRLALRVGGERLWQESDMAAAYVAERIRAGLGSGGKLLLAAPGAADSAAMAAVTARLEGEGFSVHTVGDFSRDPAAVKELRACDGVVILAQVHRSSLSDAAGILADASGAGKPVLGFVLV